MLLAFAALALLAQPQDWVPMRWISAEPASLDLLKGTPVNCLLLEKSQWNSALLDAAATKGFLTFGVLHPGDATTTPRGLSGVVFEGDWALPLPTTQAKIQIALLPRSKMDFKNQAPVIGTYQAVWPGIQVDDGGSTKAAPSGAPWIDTNSGFLRFARASTKAPIWIGNQAPAKTIITAERYQQVISDAQMLGGRWIVALDQDFQSKLAKNDAQAVKAWRAVSAELDWWEKHKDWQSYRPVGELALIQDVNTGALYSGGVLDMIAVKHTPVLPIPESRLDDANLKQAKLAVNVDPAALNSEEKETVRRFARQGGTVLNGPPDWRFPPVTSDKITLGESDVKKLDEIWKELNNMTGRRNLGARLFNVSSMLSNLLASPDGKQTLLHLVNYSGYPVENVTVHVLGKFKAAKVLAPGEPDKMLEVYEVDEGTATGVDIASVGVNATLVLN